MRSLFHKFKTFYGNLHLQTKFTIVIALAVTLPMLMMGITFFGRLYDMVVSDTIRREQDSSA